MLDQFELELAVMEANAVIPAAKNAAPIAINKHQPVVRFRKPKIIQNPPIITNQAAVSVPKAPENPPLNAPGKAIAAMVVMRNRVDNRHWKRRGEGGYRNALNSSSNTKTL